MAVNMNDTLQNLFSIAFHDAPIGMAIVAIEDGQWLQVNASLCRMLGYQPSELLGKTLQETTHPHDVSAPHELLQHIQRTGRASMQTERRFMHLSGKIVSAVFVLSIVTDEREQPAYYIAQLEDITEKKVVEQALNVKATQLESFIIHNADAIWMMNAEETVLEVNPAFEMMFGWSAAEIKGQPLPLVPDSLKASMKAVHQRIKAGETLVGLETIRQRKDGQLLDVEATLSPLREHNGTIIGVTGICRDVTPKKRAEMELKANASHLKSIIDDNVDAILIFDKNCRVQSVNRAFERNFGWSKEEMHGLNLQQLPSIPQEVYNEVDANYKQLSKGQSILGYETIRQRKNGDRLNVTLSASPILDDKGNPNGLSVTIRDITTWKLAQEHMKNAEKLSVAGQLAAGIAHEIRNPITSIKGFVQLMQAGIGEKQKYFDIMRSEIERIELILSELLILAKPQTIKYERTDIRVLLSQVITLLDSQAILNNVQFTTEIKPGVTHIYCDENQLKQVFINFIKNAIESMPQGGTLVIQVMSENDETIRICLIDEGCGIPKDVLARLGQPFYTTKESGTGLGFMVSKKIIENHAGRIHVDSEVGIGTRIEITLPVSI